MSDDLMNDSPARAAYLADLWQTVQQEGYTILDCSVNMPQLETVGCFYSFGFPDVVIHGMDRTTAARLLHAYVAASRAGRRFAYGRTYTDHASGRYLQFHRVTPNYARMFHQWELFGEQVTPWAQLVWGDQSGRWPWSRYAAGDCRYLQDCFIVHGYRWGSVRAAYQERCWSRQFTNWDDQLLWKQQIQTALVRGGWRTHAQAEARMAEWKRLKLECQAMEI